jgi:serine/threonine protein phosphatase PrpC
MPDSEPIFERLFKSCDSTDPIDLELEHGSAVFSSVPALDRPSGNEDAAGFWQIGPDTHVLAVADGLGGYPGGAEAAATAIDAISRAVAGIETKDSLRSGILDAFEDANSRLLEQGVGAATTLIVVEVKGELARTYHAGDSLALLVGQRGRLGFETISHSPTGYAVASGLLEQDDMHHDGERHLLSNCLGSRTMRVEIGPPTRMAALDTLLLGSDGVADNIQRRDLIDLIRVGALLERARALQTNIQATMRGTDPALPAHPDDATFLLFRRPRT